MKFKGVAIMALVWVSLFVCLKAMAVEPALPNQQFSEFQGLPIKPIVEKSKSKQLRAHVLSNWVIKKLEDEHVKVAVITRVGSPLAVLFDETGMTHSGYVFKNPATGQWTTYSLYSDPSAHYQKSRVWQQSIESFYYAQSGRKRDALMLVPSLEVQEKLLARLTSQPFNTLLPANEHYNLVAPLENPNSFNCTKWVLLQLFAATEHADNTEWLIGQMAKIYTTPVLKSSLLLRYALQHKPDVNWQELTPPNHIHTVTVGSLLKSSLFENKWYFHTK